MQFSLRVCRYRFIAAGPLRFPPSAANFFRSALGAALYRNLPAAYQELFAPRRHGSGPSGLADPPRPFVIRAAHLDGAALDRGEQCSFVLNVFSSADSSLQALSTALEAALRRHLILQSSEITPLVLDLSPHQPSIPSLILHFLTPTELKHEGRLLLQPDFPPLISRIRDRISTLRALYGPGPLDIDHTAFARRAERVTLVSHQLQRSYIDRHRHAGDSHPLGGFLGHAQYQGELAEFYPFLQAAFYTGVGRHTVWGNGVIQPRLPGERM